MKVQILCTCLLWCNALRVGIILLGKLEQYLASPKKEALLLKQMPVSALLINNPLVYASVLKAVILLASLPATKVSGDVEDPPLFRPVKHLQGVLLNGRNQVQHTVSKVSYEPQFSESSPDRQGASAAVMDATGTLWWDGRCAGCGYIWEVYDITAKVLEKEKHKVPEQTLIQRGKDSTDITSFKDWTKVSKKLSQGMQHSSTYSNWQLVVDKHSKPFVLAKASSEPRIGGEPPCFEDVRHAIGKGGPAAKAHIAYMELTAVETCLQASKGNNKGYWQPAYDSGDKDFAYCVQWILVMGALLTFREAYTQEALTAQRSKPADDAAASSTRKEYHENHLSTEENTTLNIMIKYADGYAHFHKDQVQVEQQDEHLIVVNDSPCTFITDEMTTKMLGVAVKIKKKLVEDLWELC